MPPAVKRSSSVVETTAERDSGSLPGGVAAVDRALVILMAFRDGDRPLTLAELSKRTGLYKSTLLRLIATLERRHFIHRRADGHYTLGSALMYLGGIYERTTDLRSFVEPSLRALADFTGEDVSFQIREGNSRVVLTRIEGRRTVREHMPNGILHPLDRGAPGHVLTRFAICPTTKIEEPIVSVGERNPELFGVASPVFGMGQVLLGTVCSSGTVARLGIPDLLARMQEGVHRCARDLTQALGGDASIFSLEVRMKSEP